MYNVHNYVIEGYITGHQNLPKFPWVKIGKVSIFLRLKALFTKITLTVFPVVLNGPTPVVKERSEPETVGRLINMFEDFLMKSFNQYSGSWRTRLHVNKVLFWLFYPFPIFFHP